MDHHYISAFNAYKTSFTLYFFIQKEITVFNYFYYFGGVFIKQKIKCQEFSNKRFPFSCRSGHAAKQDVIFDHYGNVSRKNKIRYRRKYVLIFLETTRCFW